MLPKYMKNIQNNIKKNIRGFTTNIKKQITKKYIKKNIPKAIREQCWLQTMGKKYESSCYINWCQNNITVFDFHVGHDQPESKGGTLNLNNLKPICSRCNLSMSNNYTIHEWNNLNKKYLD